MAKPKGGFPTALVQELINQSLGRALGDANFADRALGFGKPEHGRLVGKQRAVWSQVRITAAMNLADVEVPHNLGMVPVVCTLHHWENTLTPDVFLAARPVRVERWTATTCRVAILKTGGAGAVDGTLATFMVGGE